MRFLGLSLALAALAAAAPATAQTIVPNAATITTSKGDFQVPGRAFLDGSRPESRPPVTAMFIPLLQSAVSTAPVCQLEHGTQVELLEVQRDVEKRRYYFRVRDAEMRRVGPRDGAVHQEGRAHRWWHPQVGRSTS